MKPFESIRRRVAKIERLVLRKVNQAEINQLLASISGPLACGQDTDPPEQHRKLLDGLRALWRAAGRQI